MAISKLEKKYNGMMLAGKRDKGRIKVLKSAVKNFSPSVTNSLLNASGGFLAGCVATDQYIPSQVAGISTPLLVGGLLASYGIFSGGDDKAGNDVVSKVAVNVGNGMLSFWAGSYAFNMTAAIDIQTDSKQA
jgi:hypothetical protein